MFWKVERCSCDIRFQAQRACCSSTCIMIALRSSDFSVSLHTSILRYLTSWQVWRKISWGEPCCRNQNENAYKCLQYIFHLVAQWYESQRKISGSYPPQQEIWNNIAVAGTKVKMEVSYVCFTAIRGRETVSLWELQRQHYSTVFWWFRWLTPSPTDSVEHFVSVHTTVSVASVSLLWYSTLDILHMSVKAAARVHSILSVVQNRSNLYTMF